MNKKDKFMAMISKSMAIKPIPTIKPINKVTKKVVKKKIIKKK